jgi:hypothetical protein
VEREGVARDVTSGRYSAHLGRNFQVRLMGRRLRIATWLGRWSHRWFLSREEILALNEQKYDQWRAYVGLPFCRH